MAPRGIKPLTIPDDMVERELMRWLFGEARNTCRGCRHHRRYVVNGKYDHIIDAPGRPCAVMIDGSELPRGGGGTRCMTMPLSRQHVSW